VDGSYNSADASTPVVPHPPAIRTLPLLSNVALWPLRGVAMLPVGLKLPVAGS
jgi:hypothetical protein